MHIRGFFLTGLLLPVFIFACGCNKDNGTGVPQGPKWRTFTTANSPLINNHVNAVAVDASEAIWFGTNGGASTLHGSAWNSFVSELAYTTYGEGGGIEHVVNSIAVGSDGSTWFALNGGGLRRYLPTATTTQWRSYTSSDNPTPFYSDLVSQIASDNFATGGNTEIWVIGLLGVSKYTPRTTDPQNGDWTIYSTDDGLPTDWITSTQVNFHSRTIWFGSYYGDLTSYDNNRHWSTQKIPYANVGQVQCIAFDGYNNLWAGIADGAYRVGSGPTLFTTADGLPSNNVHAIISDLQNFKWIGTDGGLTEYNNSSFTTFNHSNSPLPSDTVLALALDLDNKVWIGTTGGAAVYDPSGK